MRLARIGLWLAAVLLLAGCFDLETRIKVNQDGSGTYLQVIDLPRNLTELTLSQGRYRDLDDFVADSVISTQNSLAGFPGISVLDAGAEWIPDGQDKKCRVTLLLAFDSLASWNKWAASGRRFQLKLDTTPGAAADQRNWTVSVLTPKAKNPMAPAAGEAQTPAEEPDAEPDDEETDQSPQGPGEPPPANLNVGSVRIIVEGPGPAPQINFAPAVSGIEITRVGDGAVRFSSTLALLVEDHTLQARFAGPLLSAAQLAEQKRKQRVEPSARFQRVLQIVEQRREVERTRQAALQAITQTRFELRLKLLADGRIELAFTRTYFGPTAAYFADREAMMHALTPELAANYTLRIEKVDGPDHTSGLAVTHTRRQPLTLADLGATLTVSRDGPEEVYLLTLPPLLAELDLGEEAPPSLGRLVLETTRPISGTSGQMLGPNQAALDLTPALLRASPKLVVRVPAH
jgi:hypothetical protein